MRPPRLRCTLFPFIYPPHLLLLPATFGLYLLLQTYPYFRALYVIPVRRTKGLPTASFRFHLTMDTLAVQLYTSSLPRRVRDFHPLERAHGAQTKRKNPADTGFFQSSHWPDSNRRPTHYECVALPTALQWHPNSNCHSFDATRLLPKQQPCHHDLTGNRTRVYAVRGRRLSRLTIRPKGKSRRRDSNTRPLRPERSALPN